MLKVKDLNAYYGEVQVLYDVNIDIDEGEIVTVIGSNASGKTTLLSCISGVHESSTGEMFFRDINVMKAASDEIVDLGIVQVPEGRLLFPKLTVRENLELGAFCKRSRSSLKDRMEFVFEFLPKLKERHNQLAGSLSGGEAQMCAIGRGLMAKPKMFILDEPSLGLAPIVVLEIMKLIKKIREEEDMTILIVEQNVRQSLQLADRAYVLENGRIIKEGLAEELMDNPEVIKAYLGI